jgi:hypothetical protein
VISAGVCLCWDLPAGDLDGFLVTKGGVEVLELSCWEAGGAKRCPVSFPLLRYTRRSISQHWCVQTFRVLEPGLTAYSGPVCIWLHWLAWPLWQA